MWIFLILLYGIFKGFREALKKKAMQTRSVSEVLFFYTLFAFLLVIPFSRGIFDLSWRAHLVIFLKSFAIFIAWICALNSIKRLPLSIYCVADMGRMLFSILFGVVFLSEALGILDGIGILLVLVGITLVNVHSKKGQELEEKPKRRVLLLVLASCVLNACSGTLDKWLLSTQGAPKWFLGDEIVTPSQMQFWYMLYLTALYGIYLVVGSAIKKERIYIKRNITSPVIWGLSLLFIIADRALFIANEDPNSTILVMTLLKQSSVVVSIILGKILYKEKHIGYRLVCASLIICGIVISAI